MTKETADRALYDAIEATLYSAYSLIMAELIQSGHEADAHVWLRLTAQGMKMDEHQLAANILRWRMESRKEVD